MNDHKISLFTAILMNINVMVGAGAFIMPALMAKKASTLSFLGWTGVTIIFLPLVWSIAKITDYFPGQNSFYNYSEKVLNKTSGFISGWLYFLGYSSMAATVIIALREILGNQMKLKVIANNPLIFSAIFIFIFCYLNLLSLSKISKIQNGATFFKLFPILLVISLIIFYYNPNLSYPISNIFKVKYVLPLALFGFWGFESSTNISHLIAGDKRNAFRSVMIGFCLTSLIYALFHFGLLQIMNVDNLINYSAPAFVNFLGINSESLLLLLNGVVTAAIITSYASCVFGVFLSDSANLHTMANEHLFPFSSYIKRVNKNERPAYCVWLTGITTLILIWAIENKEILTSICNLGALVSFVLTMVALLKIQLNQKVKFTRMLPTMFAFGSCAIMAYYSWIIIGKTNLTRFINCLPLIFLAIAGIIMFKLNDQKNNRGKEEA